MKTKVFTLFTATSLIVAISCTKENLSPSSAATQSSDKAVTQSYHIGQSYGGGIIFYIDSTGQHGLIASATDLSRRISWAPVDFGIGAKGTRIGTGAKNTWKIVAALGKEDLYAALLCARYKGGGFTDWFLPSKDELFQLYKHQNVVGHFAHASDIWYWSSSEINDSYVHILNFGSGEKAYTDKENGTYGHFFVRPVRAF